MSRAYTHVGSVAVHCGRVLRRVRPSLVQKTRWAVRDAKRFRKYLRLTWQGRCSLKALGSARAATGGVTGWAAHFSTPGSDFEEALTPLPAGISPKASAIAFYLPQFHANEHNDRWWGTGFSEWRNVARGLPRVEGHYQPRIPRDLGHYDLNSKDIMRAQCDLAQRAGISAFCFYYYNFGGQRLLEKPLDTFTKLDTDQEFCLMWANENWTRTWDGAEQEVLIEQIHSEAGEAAFLDDTARYLSHPRYLRVEGRPLFILYRPALVPDAKAAFARWRSGWYERLGVKPWFIMAQTHDDADPRPYGLDGAVEFPPHKLFRDLPRLAPWARKLDRRYRGSVRSYQDVMQRSLREPAPPFPLIKTLVPNWDNEARRPGRGVTLLGSTPEMYRSWLRALVANARAYPFANQPLLFVNAWNEWAEGAYLEPDVHYGHAYLNATRRALYGEAVPKPARRVLLVGHDAYRHGAQMLLLNMARVMSRELNYEIHVLLKQGGPLVGEYRAIAPTSVLVSSRAGQVAATLNQRTFDLAICNTCVTGDLVPEIKALSDRVISLVHELPNLIREYRLTRHVQSIARHADHVVFPSELVQTGFHTFVTDVANTEHIRPQGLYKPAHYSDSHRSAVRDTLGIPANHKLVLNVGSADLRKGFDVFLQTAKLMIAQRPDVHFAWVGQISGDLKHWLFDEATHPDLGGRLHLPGFNTSPERWYSAADAFYLSSREDPYPSVVLEAMSVGLAVVAFRGCTGLEDLLNTHGVLVSQADPQATVAALQLALDDDAPSARAARIAHIAEHARFDHYCASLLALSPLTDERVVY